MYKSDRHRVEDGIIPMVLESLILTQKGQLPKDNTSCDKAIKMIQEDISEELKGSKGAAKTLLRIDRKIIKFFVANKWDTRKCYMIISYLATALYEAEALQLRDNTMRVLSDINNIIEDGYKDKEIGVDIKKIDESAAKQVPRILKLIQNEGYFQ